MSFTFLMLIVVKLWVCLAHILAIATTRGVFLLLM